MIYLVSASRGPWRALRTCERKFRCTARQVRNPGPLGRHSTIAWLCVRRRIDAALGERLEQPRVRGILPGQIAPALPGDRFGTVVVAEQERERDGSSAPG
jgi:hypothetical protein